jgi:hypothetical protein
VGQTLEPGEKPSPTNSEWSQQAVLAKERAFHGIDCQQLVGQLRKEFRCMVAPVKPTNSNIKARVEEMRARVNEKTVATTAITRAYILERLHENMKRAMQLEPVRDSSGKATGEYRYEGAVANRAIELNVEAIRVNPPWSVQNLKGTNLIRQCHEKPQRGARGSETPSG